MTPDPLEHILSLDKENLLDILHYFTQGIEEITGHNEIRIYMEDMSEGALVCLYTPDGELERKGARIPIHRRDNHLVLAFLESTVPDEVPLQAGSGNLHLEWFSQRNLARASVFPLETAGQAIGILSLDAPEGENEILDLEARNKVKDLCARIMPVLQRAHSFHQQIMLNRHLDRSRKRDVARILLAGAFKLDMALDMTSVLIPVESPVPEVLREERGGYMEVLAAASREPGDLPVYETLERISLLKDKSLLSRLVAQEDERTIRREGAPDILFFENILKEEFERWEVFHQLSLRTLLMIPVVNESGDVVCTVNYFTKRPHFYSDSDLGLLKSHAQALGSSVADTGEEHLEIRVLSEIEQLLAEDTTLPVFLNRVVSIAVELVGADSGSIGLVKELDEQLWVVVDTDQKGALSGAKSRGWRKSSIPFLKVGGEELKVNERSVTGYAAYTGKLFLCNNTREEEARGGFYRNLSSLVLSELAVPIRVGDSVIGVINLDSYQERFFTPDHQRIMLLISRLIASRIADLIKISELTQKVARLRKEVSYKDPDVRSYLLGNIIGKSHAAKRLVDRLDRLAPPLTNWLLNRDRGLEDEVELGLPTILITGETGSGKEFVFNNLYSLLNERYLNEGGKKKELPIRKTNIAAYGGEMTYTELFGHRKGAYTGAHSDRQGILEEADGGVVFLDEIGDADLKTQVQLLRFLDSGEFSRLGDNKVLHSRVVFIAATNKDLKKEIEKGNFREDLYHRLSEITLAVPPLQQRREDIEDLAKHFLGRLHTSYSRGGEPPRLTPEASALLAELDYPGNIRQLVSVLQGGLFESTGGIVGEDEIVRSLSNIQEVSGASQDDAASLYGRLRGGKGDFWQLVHAPFTAHEMTRSDVLKIYRLALAEGGGVKEAAQLLGALPKGDEDADSSKALMRFKNFMYKTVGAGKAQ
jgi:transcriptional regulator with GAF, ATPase, and Fis domain